MESVKSRFDEVKYVNLAPARAVAFNCMNEKAPEDGAMLPIFEWLAKNNLRGTARVYLFNIHPSADNPERGMGCCATIPEGIEIPEQFYEKRLPGGTYAVISDYEGDPSYGWKKMGALLHDPDWEWKYDGREGCVGLEEHIEKAGGGFHIPVMLPVRKKEKKEVITMSEESKPKIITFQSRLDEFFFLGFEQIATPNTDFWDNYFKAVKASGMARKYDYVIWYYKNNEQIYFVGKVVDGACIVPEGFSLVKFPACEYLVVTHEWLPKGENLYVNGILPTQKYAGIGQTYYYRENISMPDGYERYDGPDSPITQIEKENKTKDGNRFERWVPIKKIGGV